LTTHPFVIKNAQPSTGNAAPQSMQQPEVLAIPQSTGTLALSMHDITKTIQYQRPYTLPQEYRPLTVMQGLSNHMHVSFNVNGGRCADWGNPHAPFRTQITLRTIDTKALKRQYALQQAIYAQNALIYYLQHNGRSHELDHEINTFAATLYDLSRSDFQGVYARTQLLNLEGPLPLSIFLMNINVLSVIALFIVMAALNIHYPRTMHIILHGQVNGSCEQALAQKLRKNLCAMVSVRIFPVMQYSTIHRITKTS
jgi:hypothetical protein